MSRLQMYAVVVVAVCAILFASTGESSSVATNDKNHDLVLQSMNLTQYNALSLDGKIHFGHKFGSIWKWIKCEICKKAMGAFKDAIISHGCGYADAAAAAACQEAGLGPEDPLSDICTAAFIEGCKLVAEDLTKHITSSHKLCKDIHMCK